MCRAEAPASVRPRSKAEAILSAIQIIRVQELERLAREHEASRPPARRTPRTRVGRWVDGRVRAVNSALDALIDM